MHKHNAVLGCSKLIHYGEYVLLALNLYDISICSAITILFILCLQTNIYTDQVFNNTLKLEKLKRSSKID